MDLGKLRTSKSKVAAQWTHGCSFRLILNLPKEGVFFSVVNLPPKESPGDHDQYFSLNDAPLSPKAFCITSGS